MTQDLIDAIKVLRALVQELAEPNGRVSGALQMSAEVMRRAEERLLIQRAK